MMDLVSIANDLKGAPDQWLVKEAQNPTGATPPFLVLGELQHEGERKEHRCAQHH